MMSIDQFQRAAGISSALAERWYQHIVKAMAEFGITTPVQQAMFIAQLGHESGGFSKVVESFNYSIRALDIFGKRLSYDQKQMLGRKPGEASLPLNRQMAIANLVYGNRYGNTAPGDGWKYRGRGLKQITFKDNYTHCGKALGIDLIANPELLERDEYAARSAGWYWKARNLNQYADANDFTRLTYMINGGYNGIDDRRERYKRTEQVLVKGK
ncbi:endolysin [Budvicia aquatica]|nr:endolysin [Budvicia aquatica]